MRVIKVPRGDIGSLFHAPVDTSLVGGFSNFQQGEDSSSYGMFGHIVADLNQYYQSNQYLQLAQQINTLRPTEWLDASIYLINHDDIAVGTLMQQYIMANPKIAQAYDNGLIAGFMNGYQTDYMLPYDYRARYLKATDGILDTDDTSGNDICYFTEVIDPDDNELDLLIEEQKDIFDTWEYVNSRIRRGIDPTE